MCMHVLTLNKGCREEMKACACIHVLLPHHCRVIHTITLTLQGFFYPSLPPSFPPPFLPSHAPPPLSVLPSPQGYQITGFLAIGLEHI